MAFTLDQFAASGGVVSVAFLVGLPVALGALSVAIGRWAGTDDWFRNAIFIPTAVVALSLVISFATRMEAALCVVVAAPVLFGFAIAGGLLAHFILPQNRNDYRIRGTIAVFLPFIIAYFERSMHWPSEIVEIENTIEIFAQPEGIWTEIASVPAIPPEQIPDKWIYALGFPKPIAATLNREGVGGIRTATFERGVTFSETVIEWTRPKHLAFTIRADPDFIPHTAFDEHIIVGGRFFDVLDGRYSIEPLADGRCILHLSSRHRLSTRLNAYASWWSKRVMHEIQSSILDVIKMRTETKTSH